MQHSTNKGQELTPEKIKEIHKSINKLLEGISISMAKQILMSVHNKLDFSSVVQVDS